MGSLINIAEEKRLIELKQKLSEIYTTNKIKLCESQGRFSNLSDDEYVLYIRKKEKEGKKYFWHIDEDFNVIVIGKFCKNENGFSDGRLFYFDRNGRYRSKFAISQTGQYHHYRAEIISEKELIKACKSHLKLDEKDIDNIINLKTKSICDFEGKIPEELLTDLFLGDACGEDIKLEDLLH